MSIECTKITWAVKKLGEVCEIKSGKNQKNVINPNGKYPIYGSSGIFGYADEYICDENTTIIGRKGTINSPIYVTTKFWNVDTAFGLSVKEDLNSKFLYYFCLGFNFKKLDKSTTIPSLSKGDLLSIELPVPPIKIQIKIVSKIEELFSDIYKGIEDLKIAQQQLKTYRQSVLKWAFEGKLTNENVKEGKLPQGWEMVKTVDVIKIINNGYTPKSQFLSADVGEIPFIKVYNLNFNGTLNFKKNPTFIPKANHEKDLKRSICYPGDVLINIVGPPLGKVSIVSDQYPEWNINQAIVMFRPNEDVISKYLAYFMQSALTTNWLENTSKATAGQWNVKVSTCREIPFPYCSVTEQHQIVQEIESRLSVADKMEESINESLKQAEALRQSILKKAFSGDLLKEVVQEKVYKPKNQYFFQMQIIGKVASISKKNNIEHGEMTIAKYTYLADKLFGIPTGFEFNRWHLGPYPPAIKKVVNNKQYFQRSGNHIEVVNESTLFKSPNDYTALIDDAVSSLVGIFSKYKTPAERAHKTELLATVCKVIEDIKTTDLMLVRASMKEWKIDLKTSAFKNKAEKFNEQETKSCIGFIKGKGWDEKLI